MNIKNAKDHLARARGHITSATAWLEQEGTKKEEWVNISHEIKAATTHHMSTIAIEIYHGSEKIGFIDPSGGMKIVCTGYMADWVTPNRWEVYKKQEVNK